MNDTLPLHALFESDFIAPDIAQITAELQKSQSTCVSSLNPKYALRPYQLDAIGRFEYVLRNPQKLVKTLKTEGQRIHILQNLATGSGKTLLMASNILRLYQQGYRLFVFFVNSEPVVQKTRGNFLNERSPKYQFHPEKVHALGEVRVREVTTFDDVDVNSINIYFTTIQGLHVKLAEPRENSLSFETVRDRKLVLLADEAHHLNASTLAADNPEKQTWENTVVQLLQCHRENVLLEYTATVEWENNDIAKKYAGKTLMRYDLKRFSGNRYTKDIYLLKSDDTRTERLIKAAVASYYRQRVAEKYGIALKPLILVKSARIRASSIDEEEFQQMLQRLRTSDVSQLLKQARNYDPRNVLYRATSFFTREGILPGEICQAMKDLFRNTLVVNSQNRDALLSGELDLLENPDYPKRVVFVVDMLNEGWDVLNLFDIVRLDESNRADSSIKTRDVQLIGRGARYYPFHVHGHSEDLNTLYQRRFDDDLDHDLRALEELHYHTKNNNRFIESLRDALREVGLPTRDDDVRDLRLKDDVTASKGWKLVYLFANSRTSKLRSKPVDLDGYGIPKKLTVDLPTGAVEQQKALGDELSDVSSAFKTRSIELKELGLPILQHAANLPGQEFTRFGTLSRYFKGLPSRQRWLSDCADYLTLDVVMPADRADAALRTSEKVHLAREAIRSVGELMEKAARCYVGTKIFSPLKANKLIREVRLRVEVSANRNGRGHPMASADPSVKVDLSKASWYVFDDNYGTEEEKRLIRLVHDTEGELRNIYREFFLIRNEGFLTIYDFAEGHPFEPDFIFWAQRKLEPKQFIHAFVEPKGSHLLEHDAWKEAFLLDIELHRDVVELFRSTGYELIGLPFFNHEDHERMRAFEVKYQDKIMRSK